MCFSRGRRFQQCIDGIVDSPEDEVKVAALKSLAKVGNDHCVSRIQQMIASVPADKTALRGEIQNTLQALRGKQ